MSKRIEELFLPERLRGNWKQPDKAAGKPRETTPIAEEAQRVMVEFNRLRDLISQRFSDEQSYALKIMIDDLQKLLAKRFPKEGELTPDELAAMNQAIGDMLNRIEDLVEAMEL